MSTYDLQSAVEADRAHLIHPLHHPSAHSAPKVWVSGKGSVMTDIEGNEYIDGLSGLWNVNVGHGRKELADAAQSQMSTLAYASGYVGSATLPAIQLAERLAKLTYPQINHFFFTSGGGESNESAFKTARFFWKTQDKPEKVKVIARDFGYHGVKWQSSRKSTCFVPIANRRGKASRAPLSFAGTGATREQHPAPKVWARRTPRACRI